VVHAPADQDQGLAGLKPKEQQIWREAVAAYAAGPSQKDLIFDDPLAEITSALARAGDEKSLVNTGVDARIAQVLTQAAPIYRKVWWTKHRAANRAWKAAMPELVKQHGPKVLDFITNAYRLEWPVAGYDVHVSAYSNWAGAYSTKGNLLVASSLDAGVQGAYGLETIFHEGMHQWDTQVLQALREQARKLNVPVPANLSHGLIFFTAGEAVRHIFPDHVPYAYKFGVWERGLSNVREALEQSWKPYLEARICRSAHDSLTTRDQSQGAALTSLSLANYSRYCLSYTAVLWIHFPFAFFAVVVTVRVLPLRDTVIVPVKTTLAPFFSLNFKV